MIDRLKPAVTDNRCHQILSDKRLPYILGKRKKLWTWLKLAPFLLENYRELSYRVMKAV